MTDTTQPYGYIEMEISRLKHVENEARREASDKTLEAGIYQLARMELESALDRQKNADANQKAN